MSASRCVTWPSFNFTTTATDSPDALFCQHKQKFTTFSSRGQTVTDAFVPPERASDMRPV